MPGFRNLRALVDAAEIEGKTWISSYRKAVPATTTIAGQITDLSCAGGNPIANYYASTPLESATLDFDKGIIVPQMAAGQRQFLHRWTAMVAAASATSTTAQNEHLCLMDYLMFYPFIDMDAAGEDQELVQVATLPRYTSGVGVQMFVVAQSPTVGGGRFTITYLDDNDTERTTPSLYCAAAQPSGAFVQAVAGEGGLAWFVPIEAGARGVKSVVRVNFSVANGGLCAIVLAKPLASGWAREECRYNAEPFGDAMEIEFLRHCSVMPEILNGAFLGIAARGAAGSLASSVQAGTIETIWS